MSTSATEKLIQRGLPDPMSTYWTTALKSSQDMERGSAQYRFLVDAAAQVLIELGYICSYRTSHDPGLISFLQDLRGDIERQKTSSLYDSLLSKNQRLQTIGDYNGRLTEIARNLQADSEFGRKSTIDFAVWKSSFESSWKQDQEGLNEYLAKLTMDQRSMAQALGFDGTNAATIIVNLHRYIKEDEEEIHSIDTAISYLSTLEGLDLKPWTIIAPDVEISRLIGTGSMGKVFRGKWHGNYVVIKKLKTSSGITPRLAYVTREMERWSKLHHPHVLPFLGGNNLDDDEPFVVVPFLKNRTSCDYIHQHPDCNRLGLLYETSLGLSYLHSEKITHGNIKGLNILIDDDEKPQLCDYGFAEIKAHMNSRSPLDPASSPCLGSRNWMAPELFAGGNLTFRCDVYSFGMTMYEIFTDRIPLGHASQSDLYNLVVEKHVRPARPEDGEAPRFSDAAWGLAMKCWAPSPTDRIELSTLSERLAVLLSSPTGDQLLNRPPSGHSLRSVVPATMASPRVSQTAGQWEML